MPGKVTRKTTRKRRVSSVGAKKRRRPNATAGTSRSAQRPASAAAALLGRKECGCAVSVCVVERQGDSVDRAESNVTAPESVNTKRRRRKIKVSAETARRLAAVGHPQRLAVLTLLLDGPAVYRSLQRATGLGAGPLYHHINQLRLAGLMRPAQRDIYELTRGGRNTILVALALDKIGADKRPRPVPQDPAE